MNILKIKDFCLLLFLVGKGAYINELGAISKRHERHDNIQKYSWDDGRCFEKSETCDFQ